MVKQGKIMDGADIFHTKLAVYLHLTKHRSTANLAAVFGLPRSTAQKWVKEYNRARFESILKNFDLDLAPATEGGRAEECDRQQIRRMLVRQAEAGSTAATKLLLDLEREKPEAEDDQLTVEQAVELLRQWNGPRRCSKCGHEDEFKIKGGSHGAEELPEPPYAAGMARPTF
jgi:transposase